MLAFVQLFTFVFPSANLNLQTNTQPTKASMEFQTQLFNRFIVFVILSLHFECFFKVKGHCPITLKHRVLLPKFRLRRLTNVDWLGCILACSDEPRCFSYNFCIREKEDSGVCDLNGCWVEENENPGQHSLYVYTSGCVFQQLPKKLEVGRYLTY